MNCLYITLFFNKVAGVVQKFFKSWNQLLYPRPIEVCRLPFEPRHDFFLHLIIARTIPVTSNDIYPQFYIVVTLREEKAFFFRSITSHFVLHTIGRSDQLDHVKKEELLQGFKEGRNRPHSLKNFNTNWTGYTLRPNCLLNHVIAGKTEETGRRERRHRQLLQCAGILKRKIMFHPVAGHTGPEGE